MYVGMMNSGYRLKRGYLFHHHDATSKSNMNPLNIDGSNFQRAQRCQAGVLNSTITGEWEKVVFKLTPIFCFGENLFVDIYIYIYQTNPKCIRKNKLT